MTTPTAATGNGFGSRGGGFLKKKKLGYNYMAN